MVLRQQLVEYLDQFLRVKEFNDYCPNGLQVQGRDEISKIVAGVTASQTLIDAAIERGADAILVHHGYFWKGEAQTITGIKYQRIRALIESGINLLAYHLPLDAHPQIGNNVQLGQLLGFEQLESMQANGVPDLVWQGQLAEAASAETVMANLEQVLSRPALHLASTSNRPIKRVAWCSGGAQSYIELAAELGVDAYISGEVSEQTTHLARELDIHYFAAGHHATERYGVQALVAHLAEKFDVSTEFIEIDNPV